MGCEQLNDEELSEKQRLFSFGDGETHRRCDLNLAKCQTSSIIQVQWHSVYSSLTFYVVLSFRCLEEVRISEMDEWNEDNERNSQSTRSVDLKMVYGGRRNIIASLAAPRLNDG